MLRRLAGRIVNVTARFWWSRAGAKIGDQVAFHGMPPRLIVHGSLSVGDQVTFRGGRVRTLIEVKSTGAVAIGSRSFINSGVEIQSAVGVTIGSGCLVGDEVVIQDTSFHEVDEGAAPKVAPVVIGDNVWIARRAIILPGVTIGDHAVIGAGSIVTRSVAPKTVAAGNPARPIRTVEASDGFRR